MYLMDQKGWKAKEYYVQYLQLKTNIQEIQFKIDYHESRKLKNPESEKSYNELTIELGNSVKELKTLINYLKFEGITSEDLLLLSMNLEPTDFQ